MYEEGTIGNKNWSQLFKCVHDLAQFFNASPNEEEEKILIESLSKLMPTQREIFLRWTQKARKIKKLLFKVQKIYKSPPKIEKVEKRGEELKDYEEVFEGLARELVSFPPFREGFYNILENLVSIMKSLFQNRDWDNLEKIKVVYDKKIIHEEILRQFFECIYDYARFGKGGDEGIISDIIRREKMFPPKLQNMLKEIWYSASDLQKYVPSEFAQGTEKIVEQEGFAVKVMDDLDFSAGFFGALNSILDVSQSMKQEIFKRFHELVKEFLQKIKKDPSPENPRAPYFEDEERYKKVMYNVIDRLHKEFPAYLSLMSEEEVGKFWDFISVDLELYLYRRGREIELRNLLARGYEFKQKKNFQAARECFEKVLEKEPDQRYALNELGAVFIGLRDDDNAISCFEKITEKYPKDAYAWLQLGVIYVRKAALFYQDSTQLTVRAHRIDWALELLQKGIRYHERAAEVAPTDVLMWEMLIKASMGLWELKLNQMMLTKKAFQEKIGIYKDAEKLFLSRTNLYEPSIDERRSSILKKRYQELSKEPKPREMSP